MASQMTRAEFDRAYERLDPKPVRTAEELWVLMQAREEAERRRLAHDYQADVQEVERVKREA